MNSPIEIQSLTHFYGRTQAISELDLEIPEGSIFGYLGPNGAGKTTTIDILMNLLRPTSGETRILGVQSAKLRSADLARIGYVSADQRLPPWMTIEQLFGYLQPLYPTWDTNFAEQLLRRYDLPRKRKIRQLSRGEKMKTALVSAMAFRPRVLILDEPFSGLDALVREELVEGLLDPAHQEGWTVLLSSHDLMSLEPLVDRVGILCRGKLVLEDSTENLSQSFRQVEVVFPGEASPPISPPAHWLGWQITGRTARFVDSRFESESDLRAHLGAAQHLDVSTVGLREIFLAVCRHNSSARKVA